VNLLTELRRDAYDNGTVCSKRYSCISDTNTVELTRAPTADVPIAQDSTIDNCASRRR